MFRQGERLTSEQKQRRIAVIVAIAFALPGVVRLVIFSETRDQLAQIIGAIVAIACALPGVFLVLRRLALLSDAIGHAILFGIAAAFLYTGKLESPLLLIGAALTGVLTAGLVELLHRTGRVREDAAIGLVFPALFSIGVILITRHTRGGLHIDVDAVLRGELLDAPVNRIDFLGLDDVPFSLVVMSIVLLLNVAFIVIFYKELKLATFDPGLAAAIGFAPALLHYGLITLVSVTAVGAFEAVGAILVVALMIGPPAAALLLSSRLSGVLLWSAGLAAVSAISGCWLGRLLNASYAGAMATMVGVIFLVVFMAAPEHGLIAQAIRRRTQRSEFARTMLVIHLLNHEGRPEAEEESRVDRLPFHLRWPPSFLMRVIRTAERQGLLVNRAGQLVLTDAGRWRARSALTT